MPSRRMTNAQADQASRELIARPATHEWKPLCAVLIRPDIQERLDAYRSIPSWYENNRDRERVCNPAPVKAA